MDSQPNLSPEKLAQMQRAGEKALNNAKRIGFLERSRLIGVQLAQGLKTRVRLTQTANQLGKELAQAAAPLLERQGEATCKFVTVIHRNEHNIIIGRIEANTEMMEHAVTMLEKEA